MQGVNDRWQLALAERELRARTNRDWLLAGVTMLDPAQTFVDVTVDLSAATSPCTRARSCRASRRSAPAARSGPTPGSSTARSERAPSSSNTVARESRDRRRLRGRARSLPSTPARSLLREPVPVPSTLLLGATNPDPGYVGGRRIDGARHHEADRPLLGAHPPGARRGDRRAPRRRARRPEPASSSPTARCAPGSARASAAPTCSSCRPTAASDDRSINDSIMEQLIMIDAAYRASAKRITAVCPFYGYARQDRKAEGREPITARLVADLFKAAGRQADGLGRPALRPDPGLLRRPGRPPHGDAGARATTCASNARIDPVIVSPDAGRIKVAERFAQHLDADLAFIYKRRPKGMANVAEAKEVIGDVEGRHCILTDDMIDTAAAPSSRRPRSCSSAAPPRCGRWPPTACCRARRSTG